MNKARIYFFTGSGNTLKIAQQVRILFEQNKYKCELLRMEDTDEVDLEGIEYLGLMFPVAMQSTYPNVWKFLKNLPKTDKQKVFMIDTMQTFSGGIVGPLKRLLKHKGYKTIGALEVRMGSSYNTKYFDKEKVSRTLESSQKKVSDFIENLLKGSASWGSIPILSDLMRSISRNNRLWTKFSKKKTINHEQCNTCGICIRNCPVNALELIEGKVETDHNKCVSCMRCVHGCPEDAYRIKGKKLQRMY